MIPVQDGKGKTWGLQVVYHDPAIKKRKGRDKDFCPAGLAKKGHFFLIGSPMAGINSDQFSVRWTRDFNFPAGTYRVLFELLRARGFSVSAVERFGHDARYPVSNN